MVQHDRHDGEAADAVEDGPTRRRPEVLPEGVHGRRLPIVALALTLLLLFTAGVTVAGASRPAEAARVDPCTAPAQPGRHVVAGRSYRLWPATGGRARTPAPVLLLLHGWSSSPEKIAASSGLPAAASARGWVVVAPQGSGTPARWALPGRLDGPDDVAFIQQVLADVRARACVDAARVLAAGFSNGAAFASLLACRLPLEGAVLVGGAGLGEPCPQAAGLPMLLVHGEADTVVRIDGGSVLGGRLHATPFSDAVRRWRATGAEVRWLTVPEWGHTWPPRATEAVLATFDA